MSAAVDLAAIRKGLEDAAPRGVPVAVHTSLRSFGTVTGGADTVIAALTQSFRTVMMPAFCWDSNAPPSSGDRPLRNGCDYAFYEGWTRPPVPYLVESARIEAAMGTVSRVFLGWPGVRRSDHPWHSWAAWGHDAEALVADHPWSTTNLPLERLADLDGRVLLLGVALSACTALHVAEERAGRHPFIRWATSREGLVRRVRAAGCAKGFDALMPYCRHLFREVQVGPCRILAAPLASLIECAAALFRARPDIGQCSPTCVRCRDAQLGGPVDPDGAW